MASARVSPPVAPWLNKRKRSPTWNIIKVSENYAIPDYNKAKKIMPSQSTKQKGCLHLLPGASKTNSRPHSANSDPSTQAETSQHENLETILEELAKIFSENLAEYHQFEWIILGSG